MLGLRGRRRCIQVLLVYFTAMAAVAIYLFPLNLHQASQTKRSGQPIMQAADVRPVPVSNTTSLNNLLSTIHSFHTTPGVAIEKRGHANYTDLSFLGNWVRSVSPCGPEPTVLVYVYSARKNVERRNLIRQTWASVQEHIGYTIKHLFAVGAATGSTKTMLEKADDLLEDAGYLDTYRNLTLKGLSAMTWVSQHCANASVVMKVDDDTFIDPYLLIETLKEEKKNSSRNKNFLCRTTLNSEPIRNSTSKYYTPISEYSSQKFPAYCQGYGYIWPSVEIIQRTLHEAHYRPLMSMEDVYLTGEIASRLGLNHTTLTAEQTLSLIEATKVSSFRVYIKNPKIFLIGHNKLDKVYHAFWRFTLKRLKERVKHFPNLISKN